MITPRELQALIEQGVNISSILRNETDIDQNTEEIIEISYDLQTGSYIAGLKKPEMKKLKEEYTAEIAKIVCSLCNPTSILETGVGEATTLYGVIRNLDSNKLDSYGFDLSWSRVAYANQWLKKNRIYNVTLCTGSLFHIPFSDNSIDVVYTSHSIEPNGGREEPILRELYRVTRRFLIMLEPGYELANDEVKQRMEMHGYCKNLKGISETLGFQVMDHRLFPYTANPLNPTAITVIRKDVNAELPIHVFACPKYKTPLQEIGGMLFSPEALVVYPTIGGIPCLRIENGIVASKYPEIIRTIQQNSATETSAPCSILNS